MKRVIHYTESTINISNYSFNVKLSVIVPVYNEAKIISKTLPILQNYLDNLEIEYELIIFDDHSNDETASILQKLSRYSRISPNEKTIVRKWRIIRSNRRLGKGRSISQAINLARGEFVIFMDVDLSTELTHIPELLDRLNNGADIVIGSRLIKNAKVTNRSTTRHILSKTYNSILRTLFSTKITDHQCGFKAFKRNTVISMLDKIEDNSFFWDTELLIRAQESELVVNEIPINWNDRRNGVFKITSGIPVLMISIIKFMKRRKKNTN